MSSAKSPKLETKQFLADFFELITKEIYQNEKFNDAIIDLVLIVFDQMPRIVDRETMNNYKTELQKNLKRAKNLDYNNRYVQKLYNILKGNSAFLEKVMDEMRLVAAKELNFDELLSEDEDGYYKMSS